jgi:peroxiredoxin
MLSVKPKLLLIFIFSTLLMACNEDLNPSDKDQRSVVEGTVGHNVGQVAADFSIEDSQLNMINLSDELAANDVVVLYFNMWCPLCDSHLSSMRKSVKPEFPNVQFLVIDYVSGSAKQSRRAQLANGYASETVIPDVQQTLLTQFEGTMGSTVVIAANGQVLMNEDYKQSKITSVLNAASL